MAGVDDVVAVVSCRWHQGRCRCRSLSFSSQQPSPLHATPRLASRARCHCQMTSLSWNTCDLNPGSTVATHSYLSGLYIQPTFWEPTKSKSKPRFLSPKSIEIDRSFSSPDCSNTTRHKYLIMSIIIVSICVCIMIITQGDQFFRGVE